MSLLSQLPAWRVLLERAKAMDDFSAAAEFTRDKKRFDRYSVEAAGLLLDYSKQNINDAIFLSLLDLAKERHVSSAIEALFSGQNVNFTESQPALHTALRYSGDQAREVNGHDVMPDIKSCYSRIRELAKNIRTGRYCGGTGKKISDVVNIGVGGSDLGPNLVYNALESYNKTGIRAHFISNLDCYHLDRVLQDLDPESTLFVVVSKSFMTQETHINASLARAWLLNSLPQLSEQQQAQHFLAVTAYPFRAIETGILPEHVFPLWDWVGGRFSIWSAVGLVSAICLGVDCFEELLQGAEAMDRHFRETDLAHNMPVILALLSIWNQNFLGARSQAVIPYDQRLQLLPNYLQQLLMESLGKQITRHHELVDYMTGVIVWGGVGTNSQHAFHQLLMQGTQCTPIDFIICMSSVRKDHSYHDHLLAHCLGQARTLMQGKTLAEAQTELLAKGYEKTRAEELAPYLVVRGGCPSNIILMDQLTPSHLGALIALYEHVTYVQAIIWDIDAFDQWGVEWGKKLAKEMLHDLQTADSLGRYDASTEALLKRYKEFLNKEKL